MKKAKTKLQIEQEKLSKFNKWLKSQGMKSITTEQYRNYLLGKGLPSKKVKFKTDMPRYEIPDRKIHKVKSKQLDNPNKNETTRRDNAERKKISSKHTVAIAYNKGGYQVLLESEIQDAGKKK